MLIHARQEVTLNVSALTAVFAVLYCATPALAQVKVPYARSAWTQAYKDSSVTVAFDPKSINRQDDGTYNVRMRWVYSADHHIEGPGGKKQYRSMVERRLLSCEPVQSKTISATAYGSDGKVVTALPSLTDGELSNMDWGVRKPNSSSAKALAASCRLLQK